MKSRFRFLFALFFLYALSTASDADAMQRIVVGITENPPFAFMDPDGEANGLCVEIINHVAAETGWKIVYQPCSGAQCIQRLKKGSIDLLPGIPAAFASKETCLVGKEVIATDWGQLVVHRDHTSFDILDLNGRKVAAVRSDPYFHSLQTILRGFDIRPEFVWLDDYPKVLDCVQKKEADAGIVSHLFGRRSAKQMAMGTPPIRFGPTPYYFAVAKKKRNISVLTTLDSHLRSLRSDPGSFYYHALRRWTEPEGDGSSFLGPKTLRNIGIIAGIMVLLGIGGTMARKKRKHRIIALENTIAAQEKIESELAVAREIQLQLIPDNFMSSRRKEIDIFACIEPARDVGGDFYDYFFIDRDSFCVVIGDVSGKGVPAALFMAMTKTMIKSTTRLLMAPEYILAEVNREISTNNPSSTFVTVFLAILDLNSGDMAYASAGHNPPLFIGEKGNTVLLGEAQCPAIGLDENSSYRQASIHLRHKEGLLLYTDGVTEAQDEKGRLFTQESLMNTVSLTANLSSKDRIGAIMKRIREFSNDRPLEDDLTLLALTYFSPDLVGDTVKTIVVKNDITEMDRIVEAINQVAKAVECPPVVVHDVTLAMEEIFSNIVFYGFGDELRHDITLVLCIEEEMLTLTLQDEGIPFNPLNVQTGSQDTPFEDRDKGGMGIILAKKLMDRIEYRRERGRNILRMEKHFR